MKKKNAYQVLTVFDSSKSTGNQKVDSARFKGRLVNTSGVDTSAATGDPLPVRGAPVRAADTLLAGMLRSSAGCRALATGALEQTEPNDGDVPYASWLHKWKLSQGMYAPIGRSSVPMTSRCPTEWNSLFGKLLSVEVECYSNDRPESNSRIDVTEDGSLDEEYMDRAGIEVRNMSWVDRTGRVSGILKMADWLDDAEVNDLCGLHVHVDARHLPKEQPSIGDASTRLNSAAVTHLRLVQIQHFLRRVLPRSRWNNEYCEFIYNGPLSEPVRRAAIQPKNRLLVDRPAGATRYAAINWRSYPNHGTIEFRCGAATTNATQIESWALLCRHLFDICADRYRDLPRTWNELLSTMPSWMSVWCVMRYLELHCGTTLPLERRDLDRVVAASH